jgi:hypothetical protein
MKIYKTILYLASAILFSLFIQGCSSKGSYGGSASYYSDPWAHDYYYRSRVHSHYHYRHGRPPSRPDRPKPPPSVRPPRPTHPIARPPRPRPR